MDKTIPNRLNVYIPRQGSRLASVITTGSGIVGSTEKFPDGDRIVIDYEGNIYGASNVKTYADRLDVAAGRHLFNYPHRYPTIARMYLPRDTDELIKIGSFSTGPTNYKGLVLEEPVEVAAHWVDLSDPAEFRVSESFRPRVPRPKI